MRVTVTQLPEGSSEFEKAMAALADHVRQDQSEFLLLPEMPFYPWIAYDKEVSEDRWQASMDAHVEWISRCNSFGVETIVASKPVLDDGNPHNDAFILDSNGKETFLHRKYYLPNEEGFWEATWYRRAEKPAFVAQETENAKVGAMICSDLWFSEHARAYARQGVQLMVNPRASEIRSVDKWLAGGRAAAVMSGAYCLSSNRVGMGKGFEWGGMGWIIDPNGEVLARTSKEAPFVTLDLDLSIADDAKKTYPRYINE